MIASERYQQIEAILRNKHSVTVAELSELLQVTPVTVRHDLSHMAEQGRLIRTHGGAILPDTELINGIEFSDRLHQHAEQKRRIGELAAELLQPADVVLLDSSTTAYEVAQAIKHGGPHDITVITTGIRTALALASTPGVTTIVAGGILHDTTGSVAGTMVLDALEQINVGRAILGAWGLTVEQGFTDTSMEVAELKREFVNRCDEVIAVLDSSKMGRVALATFATLGQIEVVVTDEHITADWKEIIHDQGVQLLIAGET